MLNSTTASRASWTTTLALACATLFAPACIGNSSGECQAGETCVCNGIGNCDKSCPEGGCDFRCDGIGNCNIDCAGGGCTVSCEGTGNCILECAGGDCDQVCSGTGNCICRSGCGLPDAGTDAGPADDAGMMSMMDAGADDAGSADDAGEADASTDDAGEAADGGDVDAAASDAGDTDAGDAAIDAG